MQASYITATNRITTKDLRNQLASVVDRVALRGESFVVTKFGKPKAVIQPVSKTEELSDEQATLIFRESYGSWQNRPDATTLASQIRRKAERRDEVTSSSKQFQEVLRQARGMWKDRPETTQTLASKLRKQAENRHEKFSD